jgi:hypothetical protein
MFFDEKFENQHDFDQWPHPACGCGHKQQLTICKLTFATSLNPSCNGFYYKTVDNNLDNPKICNMQNITQQHHQTLFCNPFTATIYLVFTELNIYMYFTMVSICRIVSCNCFNFEWETFASLLNTVATSESRLN